MSRRKGVSSGASKTDKERRRRKRYNGQVCWLEIHSWTGRCIGAVHSYGRLMCYPKGDCWKDHSDYEVDVKQTLTARYAARMNAAERRAGEDSLFGKLHAGEESGKFLEQADVIKAALAMWQTEFPGASLLICGSRGTLSPAEPIASLDDSLIVDLRAMFKEWEVIGGFEGGGERADELSDEWRKRIEAAGVNL